ncbi:snare associated Golgi protein-domain-containing protein [Ephemerocybe angulata]|uniref:Snare associated Golgi protein-domain-containing protein n=1 Tax=Ephemerocybe angulata TaxID=980116 RepID=A0A8H6IB52_9AGAR|nr:snare associated Golgi protein-domain-containing protein [Tulosesus angulatus]
MLVLFASKFLQWFHLPTHAPAWSAPSSPRSSSDDFILPVSAATQEAFVVPLPEKGPVRQVHWTHHLSAHTPMLFVIISLPISTAIVFYALSTLPIAMQWPKTLSDLAQLGRDLHGYSQSGPWPLAHVIAVMAISAVWKHAWSIPGSVLWNVLAGALFSPAFATIMLTALTTMGSACATLLAAPLAPFLSYMFPRALVMTRNALGQDSSDLDKDDEASTKSAPWVRLSILRLIGVVPWSGINIACGVCGVSLSDCMLGTFIGCLPWTAVTCQIGDILQTVASTPSPTPQTVSSLLTSPEIVLKLVFLSFLSLAPILGRDYLRTLIAPAASTSIDASTVDGRQPGRSWVQEWRKKIRLSSRSRTREQAQRQAELDILVQEKRRLEDLPS